MMRRKDREITEPSEITALVERCDTLRLGFCDGDTPYVVPLSFGYERTQDGFTFYVHGAKTGRRHELALSAPKVCVELDICREFVESTGGLTADYESFIGWGEIETVSGDEAVKGLELLCAHCGFDRMPCTQSVVDATCVEKICVSDFTAKRRFKPQ